MSKGKAPQIFFSNHASFGWFDNVTSGTATTLTCSGVRSTDKAAVTCCSSSSHLHRDCLLLHRLLLLTRRKARRSPSLQYHMNQKMASAPMADMSSSSPIPKSRGQLLSCSSVRAAPQACSSSVHNFYPVTSVTPIMHTFEILDVQGVELSVHLLACILAQA